MTSAPRSSRSILRRRDGGPAAGAGAVHGEPWEHTAGVVRVGARQRNRLRFRRRGPPALHLLEADRAEHGRGLRRRRARVLLHLAASIASSRRVQRDCGPWSQSILAVHHLMTPPPGVWCRACVQRAPRASLLRAGIPSCGSRSSRPRGVAAAAVHAAAPCEAGGGQHRKPLQRNCFAMPR
jgi:hypothetical protein